MPHLLNLYILRSRVIDQNEAVISVARAVKRGRVGLKDPKRPIGSFISFEFSNLSLSFCSLSLRDAAFSKSSKVIASCFSLP